MNRLELLPETGFLRLSTVLRVFPVSKSTWWAGVKNGKFPKPVKLTKRTTAWKAQDIRELIEAKNKQTSTYEVQS